MHITIGSWQLLVILVGARQKATAEGRRKEKIPTIESPAWIIEHLHQKKTVSDRPSWSQVPRPVEEGRGAEER